MFKPFLKSGLSMAALCLDQFSTFVEPGVALVQKVRDRYGAEHAQHETRFATAHGEGSCKAGRDPGTQTVGTAEQATERLACFARAELVVHLACAFVVFAPRERSAQRCCHE